MRVALAAAGSRGDVAPFGALAERLIAEGHPVTLVTHDSLRAAVPADVPVVGVASDPATLLSGPAAKAVRRGSPRALNRTRHHFADYLHSFAQPTADALRDTDAEVLIASTFAVAAVDAALSRGVPVVRAHQWPEYPSLGGPMPLAPYSWLLPGVVRWGARKSLRTMEPYLGGLDGWWSRGRLHLVPHHGVGLTTATLGTLHAYSPSVVPPSAPDVCVSGWWIPRGGQELSPPTQDLLDSGGPWVYVGFGSMPQAAPERVVAAVAAACTTLGVRAVVQLAGAEPIDGPQVWGLPEEPHEALFARMAAVVHHGGAGTTAAAVRSGTPSVVVPHFADQFYWADRLHRLGVAARPLRRGRLTGPRLTRRLAEALVPEMRRRAVLLGERVRAQDGTGVAVRYVERRLAHAPGR